MQQPMNRQSQTKAKGRLRMRRGTKRSDAQEDSRGLQPRGLAEDRSEPLLAVTLGPNATDILMPTLYQELRSKAARLFWSERSDHTLQPTALVNEAYLRLRPTHSGHWESREHFLGAVARAMRRVLLDYARRRNTLKRGRSFMRVDLDTVTAELSYPVDFFALDHALTRLAEQYPRSSQIVELRFFGGLTIKETARALSVSQSTVKTDWQFAQAWLKRELSEAS